MKALLRNFRCSPLKVYPVANLIRGKEVPLALKILNCYPKKSAFHLLKLLNSAISNAQQQESINIRDLKVDKLFVGRGRTFGRIIAGAKGRANRMHRKCTYIEIHLKDFKEKNGTQDRS